MNVDLFFMLYLVSYVLASFTTLYLFIMLLMNKLTS